MVSLESNDFPFGFQLTESFLRFRCRTFFFTKLRADGIALKLPVVQLDEFQYFLRTQRAARRETSDETCSVFTRKIPR